MATLITAAKETTDLPRAGPIWPLLTIIFVIYTCLIIPEKCALYDSFSIDSLCSLCTSPQKNGEGTALGEALGLQLISKSHLTDIWQMTQDLTNNWHLCPPPPFPIQTLLFRLHKDRIG